LLLALVSNVSSQTPAPCGYTDPVTGHVFDFSSVQGKLFAVNSNDYTYSVSVCADSCTYQSTTGAICQDTFNTNTPVAVVSQWSGPPEWQLVNAGNPASGVSVITRNGAPPNCYPSGSPRYANITFLCGSEAMVFVSESPCESAPGYTFLYYTPLACIGGGPSGGGGLSGGWVFVIILCVTFPGYFLAGFLYKWKAKGAQGIEACPNIEFWRGLPGMIGDGFKFTIAKITGLCGGKKSGEYEGL